MTAAAGPAPPAPEVLDAVEGYFRRSGLPHLTDDARGRDTTLRWRLPAAALVLVVAVVLVARSGLDPLALAASLVGVAIATALVVWVLFDLGGLSLLINGWRPVLEGLAATASVALRALPPLLAVLLFLSLASETWRAFGRLEGWRFGFVLILFGILSVVILVAGLRRERRALMAPEPGEQMEADALRTPAAPLYFVAVALGDPRNREEFLDDELERVRRVMAAWAYYRGALDAGASPSDTYQPTVRRSDSSSGV